MIWKRRINEIIRKCWWSWRTFVLIEYQKRGLPHLHFLLLTNTRDEFMNPAHVDDLICAKLPDLAIDSDGSLREIIQTFRTHLWICIDNSILHDAWRRRSCKMLETIPASFSRTHNHWTGWISRLSTSQRRTYMDRQTARRPWIRHGQSLDNAVESVFVRSIQSSHQCGDLCHRKSG